MGNRVINGTEAGRKFLYNTDCHFVHSDIIFWMQNYLVQEDGPDLELSAHN